MSASLTSVEWIWRNIAIRLPPAWEMLQFSAEWNRGRCAFADRYQFRVELNWITFKGEPDHARLISDYTCKLENEKKLTGKELLKKAGWHGFAGVMDGEITSRFGHYFKEIGSLVECVFLWPEQRDPALESEIIASIQAIPVNHMGRQRWRAFGLDMSLPTTAAFEGCTAQPAKAEFSFSNPQTGNAWHFGRFGMVGSWLKTDLGAWLTQTLKPVSQRLHVTQRTLGNISVHLAKGPFKPAGLHLKHGHLEALAWLDPIDGRIYTSRKMIRKPVAGEDVPLESLLIAAPEFTPRWS